MVASRRTSFVVAALLSEPSAALDNGVGLTPPMGYSSWNDCASEITEERVKNVTRALIRTGLAAKGYLHVNVDEGWLKERDASTGAMVEDLVKFPSGMKALGDWIHDQEVPGLGKVMKYGLYTSRGTCQCSTKLYQGPGTSGHVEQDAQWMVDAGADYLKEDSCCGSQDHPTAFADYGQMRDALNKSGRSVYFSLCGWNTWYAPEGDSLGNSWRIAGDGTNWGALSNCVNKNAQLGQYAKPGAWNDPDLLVGTGVGSNDLATNPSACFDKARVPQTDSWFQTDEQSRTQFSLWAMMSSPLLISANLDQVSDFALETWGNAEVIEVSQTFRLGGPYQGLRVMGGDVSFNKNTQSGTGANVWAKPLPGADWAIAFLNNEGTVANVTCDGACFGAIKAAANFSSSRYKIRDLWTHEDIGFIEDSLTFANVPSDVSGILMSNPCDGSDAQRWALDNSSDGRHFYIRPLSAEGVVDIYGCETREGQAAAYLFERHSLTASIAGSCQGRNQLWSWGESGALLSAMDEGKCLDVWQGDSRFNTKAIDLYLCNRGTNQQWTYNKATQTLSSTGSCLTAVKQSGFSFTAEVPGAGSARLFRLTPAAISLVV